LLDLPTLTSESFVDIDALAPWLARLEQRLAASGLGKPRYRLSALAAADEQGGALMIERQHHGLSVTQSIPAALFDGGELRPILDVAAQLADLIQAGATVARGGRSQPIASFKDAHTWLMDEAKKGRTVQRFKGLGEMNPEQLWDTTVNPETRRLLKVRIEDVVAADQIFSTLMGDVVEPRRAFIEDNALKVANLDV
jgi:DNA gyrase subunit B